MESQSNRDLIDELYAEWQALIESRLGTDDEIAIDLDGDTIGKIMETLADLHNQITIHYIKLAIYQRALLAEKSTSEPPPVGFSTAMPSVS